MVLQYLRTSYAFLRKHKLYTLINLGGLTAALCVTYFCLQFIFFELSYDSFNKNADQIYRLVTDEHTSAGTLFHSASIPMGPAVAANFPEVMAQVRMNPDYMIVKSDSDHFREEHLAYADPTLFQVFTLPLIRGDSATALVNPLSVVLSQEAALRYFGTTDCLAEQLTLDNHWPATVTGVMRDIPYNSHFRFDLFVSISTLTEKWNPSLKNNWHRFISYTYLLLNKKTSQAALQSKLNAYIASKLNFSDTKFSCALEPLKSIYLHGKARGSRVGAIVIGSLATLYLFACISLVVLVIATFNFLNLSTALSLKRIREIGVRRVFGATRRQVVQHLITDGLCVTMVALAGAYVLSLILEPAFTEIAGKPITFSFFPFVSVVMTATLIGIASGLYPAFMHTRRKPLIEKERVTDWIRSLSPSNILVTLQFAMSVLLMVAALVVYRQLEYMRDHDPGFDKHNKIAVDFYFNPRIARHEDVVRSEFARITGVDAVTISSAVPGKTNRMRYTEIEDAQGQVVSMPLDRYFVDDEFIPVYGLHLLAGRNFSSRLGSDSSQALIVNEALVKQLGYRRDADILGASFSQDEAHGVVIGVVDDFWYDSPREEVRPLVMRSGQGIYTFLTLSVNAPVTHDLIDRVDKAWKVLMPTQPLIWFGVGENYNNQFADDAHIATLLNAFAILAVLISAFGLLGLTALAVARRTKEIGIRKVLGATTGQVLRLMSKQTVIMVLVAMVLGSVSAERVLAWWLEGFAHHLVMRWWYFAFAGSVTFLLAFLASTLLSLRAANADPVKTLRVE